MSNAYVGAGGAARKVSGMYTGVGGAARRVTKGYVGAGGVARQFYSAAQPFSYAYSGNSVESEITVNGVDYVLLTLTSSGTLIPSRAIAADVWLCGGGGNGGRFDYYGQWRRRWRRIC